MQVLFLSACLLLASLLSTAAADPLRGTWQGTLQVGEVNLNVVFHFDAGASGGYTGTMDSPDQGAFGIPLDAVTLRGDTLAVRVNAVSGRYEGYLDGATLRGRWSQSGPSLPLNLTRTSDDPNARPQAAPFPADAQVWEGKLQVGPQSVRLVFHLGRQPDGTYAARLDSPDQGAMGIPASDATVDGANVRLAFAGIGATFTGTRADDAVTGTWKQGGQSFPLTLRLQQ